MHNRPLLAAIASASIPTIRDFNTQNISNTAWAFATLGMLHEPFMASISAQALPPLSETEAQDLANTSWAFSVLDFKA